MIIKFYIILPFLILIFWHILTAQVTIKISNDLQLQKISDHCFVHISYTDLENAPHYPANGLVYITHGKAFIADTPWTNELTELLIKYLQDSMHVSIEGVIATHWHVDCVGGLETVHKLGIKSYAYQLTAEICKEKNLPVPQNTFQDSLVLGSDNNLILKYLGPGHTEDNMVVYLPSEKILFAGCMAKALIWNSLGFTGDADIPHWPETLRKVIKTFPESRIVIPGHGKTGGLNILEHTLSLFKND